LILTFSTNGKLADLEALQIKSGVSQQAFEDLLQYTTQARPNSYLRCTLMLTSHVTGIAQLGELQEFRLYQDQSSYF